MRMAPLIAWANVVAWATPIVIHSAQPRSGTTKCAASAHAADTAFVTISTMATVWCQSCVALASTVPRSVSADQRVGLVAAGDEAHPGRRRLDDRDGGVVEAADDDAVVTGAGADDDVDRDEVRHDDRVIAPRGDMGRDRVAVVGVPRTE